MLAFNEDMTLPLVNYNLITPNLDVSNAKLIIIIKLQFDEPISSMYWVLAQCINE